MGGLFGVVSKDDCTQDLYFGTDYHSHLGTSMGGMAVWNGEYINCNIHNIENTQFRTKFEGDLPGLRGKIGIGCISDTEAQPLAIRSHLGKYALTTVGRINNIEEILKKYFIDKSAHFIEMSDGEINPTELVAALIDQQDSFVEGIKSVQQIIDGSCTLLLMTSEGIYAARDRYGRTPLMIGKKERSIGISMESCAFPNLGYSLIHELGPGEIVYITHDETEIVSEAEDELKICAFLWVYYGYPTSTYEGKNVEMVRYNSGAILAKRDKDNVNADLVAGVPDSGIAHAIGYANESKIPYARPFVKYTPTWPRSFIPQSQEIRNLVARMKLIPIKELIHNKHLLFCEDSIVRGTQLKETIELLYNYGAKEVHMRSACPPIIFSCKYLNFSRSSSEMELLARQAIRELEGFNEMSLEEYCQPSSEKYLAMVDRIRKRLNLTTLKYQPLNDMLDAIGLPYNKVCTYCWNGKHCAGRLMDYSEGGTGDYSEGDSEGGTGDGSECR